jgi:F420-dependent oxidoreductase-like protein
MSEEFGVFINPERPNYFLIRDEVLTSESLGFDSVWLSDHVFGLVGSPANPFYECWTTCSALAAETKKLRIGQLVLCNPFRHPSLLAKMGATLDSISNGRLILGLGTGWAEDEFKAYGYSFEKPSTRVRRVTEAAQIIKEMWTKEKASFKGRHYEIEYAYCVPQPVQKPHPPVMIAGSGEQLTLKTVARHADWSNFSAWFGSPEAFRGKVDVLSKHCDDVGRSIGEITKSFAVYVLIGENREEAEEKEAFFNETMTKRWGPGFDRKAPLRGTPEDIISQISKFREAGVDYFIVRFMGGDFHKEAKVFAEQVLLEL